MNFTDFPFIDCLWLYNLIKTFLDLQRDHLYPRNQGKPMMQFYLNNIWIYCNLILFNSAQYKKHALRLFVHTVSTNFQNLIKKVISKYFDLNIWNTMFVSSKYRIPSGHFENIEILWTERIRKFMFGLVRLTVTQPVR